MTLPPRALLEKISVAMSAAADDQWRSTTLLITGFYNHACCAAIERPPGTVDRPIGPGDDTIMWCGDLRDAMYTEGAGTRYNATITVTPDGRVEPAFDYDSRPFAGEDLPDDLLVDDDLAHPHDPARLPPGRPSKIETTG
jgi:hypothetical protein